MNAQTCMALALCLALACHHAGHTEKFGHVLERGGELANVPADQKVVRVTASTVSVWGVLEVPEGSRMQAAYAGVDAIVRSELLKLIRVRVADVMVSVDSTDPARVDAYERTVEVVGGVIRNAGVPRHGWERVQQGDHVIVRLWANLSVPRADLEHALEASSSQAGLELPPDILERLESAASQP